MRKLCHYCCDCEASLCLHPKQPCDECSQILDRWPDCAVAGCTNKVCLWMETGRCYPCSVAYMNALEASGKK